MSTQTPHTGEFSRISSGDLRLITLPFIGRDTRKGLTADDEAVLKIIEKDGAPQHVAYAARARRAAGQPAVSHGVASKFVQHM